MTWCYVKLHLKCEPLAIQYVDQILILDVFIIYSLTNDYTIKSNTIITNNILLHISTFKMSSSGSSLCLAKITYRFSGLSKIKLLIYKMINFNKTLIYSVIKGLRSGCICKRCWCCSHACPVSTPGRHDLWSVTYEVCSLTSGNTKLMIFWYITYDKKTVS